MRPNSKRRPLESSIEEYFAKRCRKLGVFVLKNTGMGGIPDRLIFKDGIFVFVELKRPGEKPSDLQRAVMKKLRRRGALTKVVDNKAAADRLLEIFDPRSKRARIRLLRFYAHIMRRLERGISKLYGEIQGDNLDVDAPDGRQADR